jgi:L-serine dehydratase
LEFPFSTGQELLDVCAREDLSISDVMLANEQAWRTEQEIRDGLLHLWSVMTACVERGFQCTGVLPGGLTASTKVSLDKAIKTMRETGADMKTKYKETACGGLAVNVIEC